MSTDNSPKEEATAAGPRNEPGAPLVIDGISYIPSSVLLSGIPKFSFKDDRAFGVFDSLGEAPRAYSGISELGLYFNDTRYLATWEMTFNGQAPIPLAQELRGNGNILVFSMTNRDLAGLGGTERIPRDTFLIRRILVLRDDAFYETLVVRNFAQRAHTLQIEQWAGGRFDDVFEVRGYPRPRRGRMLPAREIAGPDTLTTVLAYEGLDHQIRETYIRRLFAPEKIRLSPHLAGHFHRFEVPPKEDVVLKTIVSFDRPAGENAVGDEFREHGIARFTESSSSQRSHLVTFSPLSIETDNAIVNRSIRNARLDVSMLLTAEESGELYPYAGIPWFSAPFGRDGIITAYQMLPWYPKLAHGVLNHAFTRLGARVDDFTDEQPGKVFHELRRGEMSNTRELPFTPYFGSVDATPLCLVLLHEYVAWTLDLESLRRWWPAALRALAWIETYGDTLKDGFIGYAKQSPSGLVNQGWKDSHDSIMHRDGRLAVAPIRLCEVQGYAYRAKLGMSALARLLGDEALSVRLRQSALRLKARFSETYWDVARQFVYLALDGDSEPCAVLSSNMGHCLWSQILMPEQAAQVTRHLLSESMFSGFGIRTLADTEAAYNPLSYHNGSIWPHDNSLILEGFRNYDQAEALEKLVIAMLGVLETSEDFRLPELFCGFRRRGKEPPVPYEVACKPQAWAAGSIFLMIKAMLGLSMDLDQKHLVFHSPQLTPKINFMEIKNFQGRDWEIDVVLRRSATGTTVDVTRRHGNVRVLTIR